jgi:lambda family phage portal protein
MIYDQFNRPLPETPLRRVPPQYFKTRSSYEASDPMHTLADWQATGVAADQLINASAQVLRNRARSLERENPYVRRWLSLLQNNVFGPTGIQFECNCHYEHRSDRPNRRLNETVEEQWELFAKRGNYDVTGNFSCLTGDAFALRRCAIDGEIWIRLIRGYPDNPWRLAIQFLESEAVDATYFNQTQSGNQVLAGVELNQFNRPVAYYVNSLDNRFGVYQGQRVRVDARDMIHLMTMDRLQTRGVPWITSAILQARQLAQYEIAEVTTARVTASKMGFIEMAPDSQKYDGSSPDEFGNQVTDMAPGQIEILGVGQKFTPFDPGTPSGTFAEFKKAMLRSLACSFDCNYNVLASDLEGVNYSSLRTGDKHDHEVWRWLQNWYIETVRERIFTAWLETATMAGAFSDVPGYDYTDIPMVLESVKWSPRGFGWVDPLKDAQAAVLEINAKLDTRTAVLARKGMDIEDVFETLAREEELADEYGIDLTPVTTKPSTSSGSGGSTGAGTGDEQEPPNRESDHPLIVAPGAAVREPKAPLYRRGFVSGLNGNSKYAPELSA